MTKLYTEMSYDELHMHLPLFAPPEYSDACKELIRKSGAMDAICQMAAEMDADGWVCVPREATSEMEEAAEAEFHYADHLSARNAGQAWEAMIAAAPSPNHAETA